VSRPVITADEYRHMLTAKPRRAHKYRAVKVELDGHRFDSQAEASQYRLLRLMEREGIIRDLELQPRFLLKAAFTDSNGKRHRKVEYVADFQYVESNGHTVIEDVKGVSTPVFRLKEKLFRAEYPELDLRVIQTGANKRTRRRI